MCLIFHKIHGGAEKGQGKKLAKSKLKGKAKGKSKGKESVVSEEEADDITELPLPPQETLQEELGMYAVQLL